MSGDGIVYKIVSRSEWEAACREGAFAGSADDARDGFIHLSTAEQVAGTAARHFRGCADLLLVALDAARLSAPLRWEVSRGGALFPHLYGRMETDAAIRVLSLTLDASGVPVVPEGLARC